MYSTPTISCSFQDYKELGIEPALVHGDMFLGNVILRPPSEVKTDNVVAVIDWQVGLTSLKPSAHGAGAGAGAGADFSPHTKHMS